MYEYKVLNCSFPLNNEEDLKKELKKYTKDGWNLFNIVSNLRRNGTLITDSAKENESTVILERVLK